MNFNLAAISPEKNNPLLTKNKPITITIDGPAGSGKTTTAERVAEKLGYLHLDSGALYRAATLKVLLTNTPLADPTAVFNVIQQSKFDLQNKNGLLKVFLDCNDVSEEIRLPHVSENISSVAANLKVRQLLTNIQRKIAAQNAVVVEGRDTGSVVFPDAALKIFMIATIEERAKRRYKELKEKGIKTTLETVKKMIESRDSADENREHSPLIRPKDAIGLDTSKLSISEQVDFIVEKARSRGA